MRLGVQDAGFRRFSSIMRFGVKGLRTEAALRVRHPVRTERALTAMG